MSVTLPEPNSSAPLPTVTAQPIVPEPRSKVSETKLIVLPEAAVNAEAAADPPPEKISAAPLASEIAPPPASVNCPVNSSVPLSSETVPLLVKATPILLVPVVTALIRVPSFMNAVVPLKVVMPLLHSIANVAPASFRSVAPPAEPVPEGGRPRSIAPAVQVRLPWFSTTRPPSR